MGDNKKLEDLSTIIVELVDKGTSFNDILGRVTFASSCAVQQVRKTPAILNAVRNGVLKEVNSKRLEEFKVWREEEVAKHRASKKSSNDALAASSVTANQKLAALQEELKTAKAELKVANENY